MGIMTAGTWGPGEEEARQRQGGTCPRSRLSKTLQCRLLPPPGRPALPPAYGAARVQGLPLCLAEALDSSRFCPALAGLAPGPAPSVPGSPLPSAQDASLSEGDPGGGEEWVVAGGAGSSSRSSRLPVGEGHKLGRGLHRAGTPNPHAAPGQAQEFLAP